MGQIHTHLLIHVHDEPGAVEAAGGGPAPYVRTTQVFHRDRHHLAAGGRLRHRDGSALGLRGNSRLGRHLRSSSRLSLGLCLSLGRGFGLRSRLRFRLLAGLLGPLFRLRGQPGLTRRLFLLQLGYLGFFAGEGFLIGGQLLLNLDLGRFGLRRQDPLLFDLPGQFGPAGLDLFSIARDLSHDRCVLLAQALHLVEIVHQVGERGDAGEGIQYAQVPLFVDLDQPISQGGIGRREVGLGLGQLLTGLLGRRLGLRQAGLGVVIVLDGRVEQGR